MKNKKIKVLVIAAHPDDETVCAGTLLKLKKKGAEISQLVLTSAGEGKAKDGKGKESYEESAKKRKAEMAAVVAKLGMKEMFWFGEEDLGLKYSKELMLKVVEVIRKVRPNVVMLMNEEDSHIDHGVAYKLGIEAVRWAASGVRSDLGEAVRADLVLQMGGMWPIRPDLIVDVTSEVEEKIELLKLHGSQADSTMIDFEMAMMTLYGYHLRTGKEKKGEPFLFCPEFPSSGLIEL